MAAAPKRIGSIINQLMARRGYAQGQAGSDLAASVSAALGPPLASAVRTGNVRRGVLEIYAIDSVTLQELTFQKRLLLRALQKDNPGAGITDLRFRLQ